MIIKLLVTILSLLTSNLMIASKGIAQNSTIKTKHVAGSYHLLYGGGVNVGVSVGEDGILIIDDHYATLTDEVRSALKKLGSDKPEFIINTHLHGDHTGGNESFGKESHILAHKNVRKRLASQPRAALPPMSEVGLPVITFDEGLSFHFNGEELKVIHFSEGHTDGDAIVYFTKSNVLHLSDQYFEGRFPYVDLDNWGDVANYAKNVEKIMNMMPDDVIIIPGHGNVSNLAELKEFHDMLIETITIIWKQMSRHKSLDDLIEKGLPKKYKKWGWNFITEERWITTVYESYKDLVGK